MSVDLSSARASRRAFVYGTLARLYHYPPDKSEDSRRIDAAAAAASESGVEQVAELFSSLLSQLKKEKPEVLKQDFNDLFMVPTGRYVTPYESVYVDEAPELDGQRKALTFGPSTVKVCQFYQSVGLKIQSSYTELPDFIGLELACMEYLCLQEFEFSGKGSDRARDLGNRFAMEHLAKWVPTLAGRIKKSALTDFYRMLGEITEVWVKRDAAEI